MEILFLWVKVNSTAIQHDEDNCGSLWLQTCLTFEICTVCVYCSVMLSVDCVMSAGLSCGSYLGWI